MESNFSFCMCGRLALQVYNQNGSIRSSTPHFNHELIFPYIISVALPHEGYKCSFCKWFEAEKEKCTVLWKKLRNLDMSLRHLESKHEEGDVCRYNEKTAHKEARIAEAEKSFLEAVEKLTQALQIRIFGKKVFTS